MRHTDTHTQGLRDATVKEAHTQGRYTEIDAHRDAQRDCTHTGRDAHTHRVRHIGRDAHTEGERHTFA